MSNLFLLLVFLILSTFDFSDSQDCLCQDFCSEVQSYEFIVEGTVKKISDDGTLVKYRVHRLSNLKGRTGRIIWIYGNSNDSCLPRLEKKKTYLLFLSSTEGRFWLSSCSNREWSEEYSTVVKKCFDCPLVKCRPCSTGYLIDANGCRTCECSPCPNGEPLVQCFAQPCSFQSTHCPAAASCQDDYCGGCKAHYFDVAGNEICKDCPDVLCTLFCEYGFKTDNNGCPICSCNQCPNGEPLVNCLVEPCSNQATECPQADSCVDDYCGGCHAHYFDVKGNEICKDCPDVTCKMFCKFGFKTGKDGCPICECNLCPNGEPPYQCFVEPCSLQSTDCPQAESCVDDYCGGCNAHYYDASGNEICTRCPGLICDVFCEYGFKTDDEGCPICECNECPNGEPPAKCLLEPCSLQSTECPQASSCLNDYCVGCKAHYFDDDGNEICTGCPQVKCSIFCESGFQKDENGCNTCLCVE